jgi:hypothetical protein
MMLSCKRDTVFKAIVHAVETGKRHDDKKEKKITTNPLDAELDLPRRMPQRISVEKAPDSYIGMCSGHMLQCRADGHLQVACLTAAVRSATTAADTEWHLHCSLCKTFYRKRFKEIRLYMNKC